MTLANEGFVVEKYAHRKVVLRMYWDGEQEPSVQAPLGDFFGMGHGITRNFVSAPLQMSPQDGQGMNCWWPMPYGDGARITVTNECNTTLILYYYVDYETLPELPADTLRFHAWWNRECPTDGVPDPQDGQHNAWCFEGENPTGEGNYLVLNAKGTGHYCGCHVNGATWTQVDILVWQAKDENDVIGIAPNFAQIYPMKADGYVYIYGIGGGRSGGTKLGRVLETEIEDFEAYEYFAGYNANGEPIWRKGSNGLSYIKQRDSAYIIDLPCGEMCVTYNEYLKKYIAIYQSGSSLVYRTADTPWGTFSAPETILSTSADMRSAYGAFTCQQLSDHGGKRIWIMVSEWTPVYNVSQIEIVFK